MSKDKHALIKANIALNKKVQELESRIADDEHFVAEILEQNKRYRELLKKIKEMTRYDDCREAEIFELVSDELEGEE